jgi:hypothetical protein
VLWLCDYFEIPLQVPGVQYKNRPLFRMDCEGPTPGGPDCVGVFGHRDNTHDRGQGDPGDYIKGRLIAAGAEPLDYDAKQDREVWRLRQRKLNRLLTEKRAPVAPLIADGLAGPATIRAMKSLGYTHGRQILI